MPDFAKDIEVIREGRQAVLRVDGDELPWLVGESMICESQCDAMPSIKIELFADRVDVQDRPWPSIDGTGPCNYVPAWQAVDPIAPEDNHATPSLVEIIEDLQQRLSEVEEGAKVGTAYIEIKPVIASP